MCELSSLQYYLFIQNLNRSMTRKNGSLSIVLPADDHCEIMRFKNRFFSFRMFEFLFINILYLYDNLEELILQNCYIRY